MPKVSVVLTSYNHADFISESIESILNQTFSDFELYIVDDCSPDRSWEIIQDYAKKDSRIIPIRHERNIGGAIKPDLINQLKGKYFCIAHCDDKWALDKLAKQVTYLNQHPKVGACFTWVEYINESSHPIKNINHRYANFNVQNRSRYEWLRHFFYEGNCLCHPSVMLRTKVQTSENLYSKGLGALPDLNRWIKLCLKHEIYLLPEKLTFFRLRDNELNTSGYTSINLLRGQFDTFEILNHYKNLPKSDFLKIFPEAKFYLKNGQIITNFALARLCIDKVKSSPHTLFGLQLIYDLLQDSNLQEQLIKLYSYTGRDFTRETGEKDVFRTLQPDDFLFSTLYLDNGNGFSESHKISQTTLLKNRRLTLTFTNLPNNLRQVRFDPDETKLRKFKNIKFLINNQPVDFHSNQSFKDNDWHIFLTCDPQFILSPIPPKITSLKITMETAVLSDPEITTLHTKLFDTEPHKKTLPTRLFDIFRKK